jgi:hypothetical protein
MPAASAGDHRRGLGAGWRPEPLPAQVWHISPVTIGERTVLPDHLRQRLLTIVLCLPVVACARSGPLPLPENLVDLGSEQGQQLLLASEARAAYTPLGTHFVTQRADNFCGVASIVMVLNALQVPPPVRPGQESGLVFTQNGFLDERAEAVLPRAVLDQRGMTLDEIGRLLALYPVEAEVRRASESSLQEFRAVARDYLSKEGHFVIVNYLRRAIGQEQGGHISPLAAYDAETDRFLVLDVARRKYPPAWVGTGELFAAMRARKADGPTRGFVLVKRASTSRHSG